MTEKNILSISFEINNHSTFYFQTSISKISLQWLNKIIGERTTDITSATSSIKFRQRDPLICLELQPRPFISK